MCSCLKMRPILRGPQSRASPVDLSEHQTLRLVEVAALPELSACRSRYILIVAIVEVCGVEFLSLLPDEFSDPEPEFSTSMVHFGRVVLRLTLIDSSFEGPFK